MAGPGFRYETVAGVNLLLRHEHDVLDRIGGGQASARVTKGFQVGIFRFVPQLSAKIGKRGESRGRTGFRITSSAHNSQISNRP